MLPAEAWTEILRKLDEDQQFSTSKLQLLTTIESMAGSNALIGGKQRHWLGKHLENVLKADLKGYLKGVLNNLKACLRHGNSPHGTINTTRHGTLWNGSPELKDCESEILKHVD